MRALADASGVVTDHYSYTAFGELLEQQGGTDNPYRYTAQQYDESTGLYQLRARYYDPTSGRFLSRDSHPIDTDDPSEVNRYVYVANSPIDHVDPGGHQALVEYSSSNSDDTAEQEEELSRTERMIESLMALPKLKIRAMFYGRFGLAAIQFERFVTVAVGWIRIPIGNRRVMTVAVSGNNWTPALRIIVRADGRLVGIGINSPTGLPPLGPVNHGEWRTALWAWKLGFDPMAIGASRKVCPGCATLWAAGIMLA